jgi:hypothetical protein
LGRIVAAIEARPDPDAIDFGFLLLALSEKATIEASRGVNRIAELARRDGQTHDLTLGFTSLKSGVTVHCSAAAVPLAEARLRRHCERRKYSQRADTWFGICIHPGDESLRFGFKLHCEWQPDARLEQATREMPRSGDPLEAVQPVGKRQKLGRNDPCPCGSGRKHKKCHGR